METLHQQCCFNHTLREAVARCPECKNFFCRECITEHDDRVICATCLKKLARVSGARKSPALFLRQSAFFMAGIVTAWLFFYWIGQGLLSIPTDFHDGTIWKTGFWNE